MGFCDFFEQDVKCDIQLNWPCLYSPYQAGLTSCLCCMIVVHKVTLPPQKCICHVCQRESRPPEQSCKIYVICTPASDKQAVIWNNFFSSRKTNYETSQYLHFPISIHPKPVNEWQGAAVPVTSLLLEKIRTLMAQPYCSFHSIDLRQDVPQESFLILFFR